MNTNTSSVASGFFHFIFRRIALILLCMTAALSHLGCDRSDTSTRRAISSLPESTGNHEWFVVIADGLSPRLQQDLRPLLDEFVTKSCREHDVVVFLSAPDYAMLSSVDIPGGNFRTRIQNPQFRSGMSVVLQHLDKEAQPVIDADAAVSNAQVNAAALPEAINGLRSTTFPIRVIVIGDAIYANAEEPAWHMEDGCVLADGVFRSLTCPFGRAVPSIPAGTSVYWCTPSGRWGLNDQHRKAVHRFYRLFFESKGGALQQLASTPRAVFERALQGGVETEAIGAAAGDHDYVGLWQIVRPETGEIQTAPAPSIETHVMPEISYPASAATEQFRSGFVPESVDRLLREVPEGEILIAINWILQDLTSGSGDECDVDMRIFDSECPAAQLWYNNMSTSFGALDRDIRKSGSIAGSGDDFASWECAHIHHNEISRVQLWLNAYRTSGPLAVRMILVQNGKRTEQQLAILADHGDEGKSIGDLFIGQSHPAWLHVDLSPQQPAAIPLTAAHSSGQLATVAWRQQPTTRSRFAPVSAPAQN